eukprot:COSAG04_NODE_17379_length_471_cov_0.690860_1_plen_95_part_10
MGEGLQPAMLTVIRNLSFVALLLLLHPLSGSAEISAGKNDFCCATIARQRGRARVASWVAGSDRHHHRAAVVIGPSLPPNPAPVPRPRRVPASPH